MAIQTASVESTSTVSVGLRLEADLRIAERVHRSMIPKNGHRGPLDVACDFRPMMGVGGDYATVHFQDARHVVVGVCDIAGHGIGSALLAARVNSFVLSHAPTLGHPCDLVESLNAFVYEHFHSTRLYLTYSSLVLDLGKNTVVWAGCGHPPVFLYAREDGTVRRLESDNPPIGLFEHLGPPCAMKEVAFRPGDRLVLYTDGLTESMNSSGEEFGLDRIEALVSECAQLSAADCASAIMRRLREFRQGHAATDDQLLLIVSYLDKDTSGQLPKPLAE